MRRRVSRHRRGSAEPLQLHRTRPAVEWAEPGSDDPWPVEVRHQDDSDWIRLCPPPPFDYRPNSLISARLCACVGWTEKKSKCGDPASVSLMKTRTQRRRCLTAAEADYSAHAVAAALSAPLLSHAVRDRRCNVSLGWHPPSHRIVLAKAHRTDAAAHCLPTAGSAHCSCDSRCPEPRAAAPHRADTSRTHSSSCGQVSRNRLAQNP
jgi:hypothetical protein